MIIIDRWRCVLSIIIIIIGGRGCELVRYHDHELASWSWLVLAGAQEIARFSVTKAKMLQNAPKYAKMTEKTRSQPLKQEYFLCSLPAGAGSPQIPHADHTYEGFGAAPEPAGTRPQIFLFDWETGG